MSFIVSGKHLPYALSKLSRSIKVLSLITMSAAMPVFGDANNDIDEVIVSALRIDTSYADSGSSVSIITGELIKSRGYVYVLDAISSASGVTTNQNGSFGGLATVSIRGADTNHTLVLLDGFPINDTTSPGGGFNFNSLDASSIERIEILKGPQSTLWGSDAIGGVINIISKQPEEGLAGGVFLEYGSFATSRIGADVAASGDSGSIRLAITNTDTHGISSADEKDGNTEEDAFDTTNITLTGGLNLPGEANLRYSFKRIESDTDFDGFGLATGVIDADERSESQQNIAQISLNGNLFDIDHQLSIGHSDVERDNFSNGAPSFSAEGERQSIRYQGGYEINDDYQLTFGLEREETESGSDDSRTDSVFLLLKTEVIEDVALGFGIRRDDHEEFGDETTGQFNVAWHISDDLTLRSSWGQGFKAPTIFQTTFFCCGAVGANPNLLAEEADAWDLGVEFNFAGDKGRINATYFDRDTKNLIDFSFADGGYSNISKAEASGLELDFFYEYSNRLDISANATYTDSKNGDGNRLDRKPRVAAEFSLAFQPSEHLNTAFVASYNGNEKDSRGEVNSWTRIDLSATYQINEQFEVYSRIENLLDKDYQQIFGYGTPGRSGNIGLRYRFQ